MGGDEAARKRDLLDAGDLQPGALLQRLHELRRGQQRRRRAQVEPGHAAAERRDVELAVVEVRLVDVRDLQLAAVRGLEVAGDLHHLLVVEVQARDGPARPRVEWLLLYAERAEVAVELDDAVALRVVDLVGEDIGTFLEAGGAGEEVLEVVAVEEVVAEDQAAGAAGEEFVPDEERLGDAVGPRLDGVGEGEAEG